MDRRNFIAASMSMMLTGLPMVSRPAVDGVCEISNKGLVEKIKSIPKLFCTAYITPDAKGQEDQESIVARYPMVIVPQDTRKHFVRWRDIVKGINPDIVMLGYQMVIEETTVPGPGHDRLRMAVDSWSKYFGGYVPTVGPSNKRRRIFDPRKPEWKERFIEGCLHTVRSYPYDGLFLDQCTIFPKANPNPLVRDEMREALQEALIDLRKELPDMLLVGNCRNSWAGLNGEMNESRRKDLNKELAQFTGHCAPRVELVQTRIKSLDQKDEIIRDMKYAHENNAFYAAAIDYQHAIWLEEFDEVIEAHYGGRP